MAESDSHTTIAQRAPDPAPKPEHPDRIGPYHVLQLLAQGGMGLVYVAEQTSPVRRRVALKVIKAGMDTREVVARFESERQALAVMDHPNIAKVLDGGVTDDRRPYFVMELVKGVPITDYCDTHKLSTSERLALFVDVCHAVQHAHQKGVVHRDLKPSNVLVMMQDGKPMPKVIDFGIAKALSQPLTNRTLITEIGQAMGTPAYMSPEQADPSALDIDTRTDVYSLGVMLYELLVGRLPLDPSQIGLSAFMVRLARRETSPSIPSAMLRTIGDTAPDISGYRRTNMKSLRRELRGDLDWIVMKALEPDRVRRYDTVNELAADINRHLHSVPVIARPPSTLYRVSRFARRNRGAVLAGSLVVLALVVGLSVSAVALIRAQRAEALAVREAETARQVSGFLTEIFQVSDPGEARGNSITAREILDRGAERIRTELTDQPLVQAQLMFTIGSVYRELGLFAEARPLLEQAMSMQSERLDAGDPALLASRMALGRLAQQQGRFADAESLYRQSLQATDSVGTPDDRKAQAFILSTLGGMMVTRGQYASADSVLTRAVALRDAAGAPEDAEFARTLRTLASSYLADGRYAEAEPVYKRALAIYERVVGADHPDVGRTLSNLGVVYYQLGQYDQAEREYQRAEQILGKALGADHPNLASINLNLGEIAWRRGRLPDAETRLMRALAIWTPRVDPQFPGIATAEFDLGNVLRDMGRRREAETRYLHALEIRDAAFGASSSQVQEILVEYARLLRADGRGAEADRMDARVKAMRSEGS